jgi:pimeloyl-ACP methyl ester carboxylesterase
MSAGQQAGSREVPIGRTRLSYRVFGPVGDPTTLLLHPWFGCWEFWEPVLPALAPRRCLVADLYSPSLGDWRDVANADSLAESLVAVLDAEGAAAAVVVGNSMGGILGQLLAARHPDRVAKLVLVGTGATSRGLHSQFAVSLAGWIETREPSALEALTRGLVAPRAAHDPLIEHCVTTVAALDADYVAAIPRATMGLDLRPLLGSITAPTLVVRGELDGIRTPAHAQELAGGIRGARMLEIPGGGHSPMVDSTTTFNRILVDFLAE